MKCRDLGLILSAGLLLALLTLPAGAVEGDSLWSHTYGGSNDDWANCVIPSGDGGFLLAGVNGFGVPAGANMWLVKVNAQGDFLWSRTYGGSNDDWANAIIPSGDGSFLLAGMNGIGAGMGLVKVNAQGDSLWSRTYGGGSFDEAASIIPLADGGFLLAGGTGSFGAGDGDMWLVKVNAQGDSLWSHTYGGGQDDWAHSIISSGDGGFLLAGRTGSFGAGDWDMWLVKVDADGDSLWSHTYGGFNSDGANCIIPSGDGGFLLAGWTWSFGAGGYGIWLVKVDADGDSLWSRTYGGTNWDEAYSIIPLGDGGFLLAGRTWSFGAGDEDMWLVKVDAEGDSLWSHTYGGNNSERANSIIPSGDGGFLLAGWTSSFGAGAADMWLVKVEGPDTTAVQSQSTKQPLNFVLHSPHPNPFNPTTVLSFESRVPSHVSLRVYDTAGRLVEMLVDGWREAGEHEVTFDGSGLAAGVYLTRLEAGGFSQTQKLVLLK